MPPQGRPGRLFIALVALVIAVAIAASFLVQKQSIAIALAIVDRLSLLACALLILLSATAFGAALLRWLKLRPAGHAATAIFGAGLGLVIISFLTLIIGAAGFLTNVRAVIFLLAMLAVGTRDLGVLLRAARLALHRVRAAQGFRIALWIILGLFLLMNVTRAYEPPYEYDDLEYHLAAPADYYSAGRVFFMSKNAYANFPQNVEMLHYLCMSLTGSPDRGAIAGQILQALIGFLAAMALREMVAGVARKRAGDWAAAIFYTWAGITVYSGLAHVELTLIFYSILAFWGMIWSWRRKLTRPGPRGWIILSAFAAGAAMGVKYTGALIVFLPLLFWIIATGALGATRRREILRRLAVYAAVAVLVFSPWLIRNYVNTRNPVYPLLGKVFRSPNWSEEKEARFTQAHSAKDFSSTNFVAQAREAVFVDNSLGAPEASNASLLMILFVPFALLVPRRQRMVALVIAVNLAILYFLWFFFTQQITRFLETGFPLLAALSAMGLNATLPSRHARGLRYAVILLLLIEPSRWVAYLHANRSFECALGAVSTGEHLNRISPRFYSAHYSMMQAINNLPAKTRVLFLGEARSFYCRHDCDVSTVFDTNTLEEISQRSPDGDFMGGFQAYGISHLYVEFSEMLRLQTTYSYFYKGQERLGMLDGFDWKRFGEFAKAHLSPIASSGAPSGEDPNAIWEKWPEILKQPGSAKNLPGPVLFEIR